MFVSLYAYESWNLTAGLQRMIQVAKMLPTSVWYFRHRLRQQRSGALMKKREINVYGDIFTSIKKSNMKRDCSGTTLQDLSKNILQRTVQRLSIIEHQTTDNMEGTSKCFAPTQPPTSDLYEMKSSCWTNHYVVRPRLW